jgi:hypothetical protein
MLPACIFTGVAMVVYPGGTLRDHSTRGYSFFQNSLSDLGMTVAWGGQPNYLGALLFVCGFGFFVVACVGCTAALIRSLFSSRATRAVLFVTMAAGAFSGAALAGAMLTPQDRYPALHGRFSLLALAAGFLATLLVAWATSLDWRFRRRVPIGWLVLAAALMAWWSVKQWRPTTDLGLALPVTLQKVVAVVVVGTLIFQSYEADRVNAQTKRDAA